jgi:hypothetical protein
MKTYEKDGKWFAETDGGHENRDTIAGQTLGPFVARPEPVARWQQVAREHAGTGHSTFTRFAATADDGTTADFTVHEHQWFPAWGYNADIGFEDLSEELPPTLGESFAWGETGWVPCVHPMAAEVVPARKENVS